MYPPTLTVVIITQNEAPQLDRCLASLALQRRKDFEVLVIDIANDRQTTDTVVQAQHDYPVPLRLETTLRPTPHGAARALAVQTATADSIAFLSPWVRPEADWTHRAIESLRLADIVHGRDLHIPTALERVAAATRRVVETFHPSGTHPDASDATVVYRKDFLLDHPFDPAAETATTLDRDQARRAVMTGHRVVHDPSLIVRRDERTPETRRVVSASPSPMTERPSEGTS
ncbi:MAG: glycosyltransferase family 2 protein [Euryarchaeota archaeon]|nr:glycosyltransferase family 2 protein [Euryarchaeota archaeon]